jgi:hypothetical protein
MGKQKKELPDEVREFFADIGRRNGKKLYEQHGPEYFSKIASMRKNPGRKKKEVSGDKLARLADGATKK